jgi:Uma2 family endonuclease
MTIATDALISAPLPEIEYPESDGKPMAESDFQRPYVAYGTEVLEIYFADRPDVYVSGNLLIYYAEGNSKVCVSPDVFVVMGRPKGKRSSYRVWKEGDKYPDFVLEITSKSTVHEDQGTKKGLYAYWGVQEYFQYDPSQDYLSPSLQGLRLVDGNYVALPSVMLPDGGLAVVSQVLGLTLRLDAGELRFYTTAGERLLSHGEAVTEVGRMTSKADRLAAKLRELGIDPETV